MNVSRPDFRSQLLVYRNFGARVVRLLFYWSHISVITIIIYASFV